MIASCPNIGNWSCHIRSLSKYKREAGNRRKTKMALDLFDLAKLEYTKLKDEQIKRIGFRDNLLYVNLLLASGIFSFVFSDFQYAPWKFNGLLLAGWVVLILGWTYVVNDEKISAIGRYIRGKLLTILGEEIPEGVLGWEIEHRSDKRRKRRKIEQLVIDEFSFVGVATHSCNLLSDAFIAFGILGHHNLRR